MKLKEQLKKFSFLKRSNLSDSVIIKMANHLASTIKGRTDVLMTPMASKLDPIEFLVDWHIIVLKNQHKLNEPLLALELSNKAKAGPRSIQLPWSDRIAGLKAYFTSQSDSHIPKFYYKKGDGDLAMCSIEYAASKLKLSSSAGLPELGSKSKYLPILLENFDELYARNDSCVLYTRTAERSKTRNVWGFPAADTLFEMMIYLPLLIFQRTLAYRAALVSPDATADGITRLIKHAIENDEVLYCVDFAAYDASVKWQYIVEAFEYIKSHFAPMFHPFINYACKRCYTISIITPSGIYRGNHGVPSGSTFTNEIDSIVQYGIASTSGHVNEHSCMIQGDDGVYCLPKENIADLDSAFEYAGLRLEKSKCNIASDHVIFCQNLYHIDYINEDGHIGGIYPTFRAINRLMFPERFVNFSKHGIKGKDYYGARSLAILENCKYHPLFEELVRYVLSKEKFNLDVSDDGLTKYCKYLNLTESTAASLNHQYGSQVMGIRNFEAYKLVKKILAEEELVSTDDDQTETD